MARVYECGTCGVITENAEQLCDCRQMEDKGVYCSMAPVEGSMCGTMKEHLTYVCGSCGRVAEQTELLCNPSVPW